MTLAEGLHTKVSLPTPPATDCTAGIASSPTSTGWEVAPWGLDPTPLLFSATTCSV